MNIKIIGWGYDEDGNDYYSSHVKEWPTKPLDLQWDDILKRWINAS